MKDTFPHLVKLVLSDFYCLTLEFLHSLCDHCPRLTHLHLTNVAFMRGATEALPHLPPHLRCLSITLLHHDISSVPSSPHLSHITHLSALSALTLDTCNHNEPACIPISSLPLLQALTALTSLHLGLYQDVDTHASAQLVPPVPPNPSVLPVAPSSLTARAPGTSELLAGLAALPSCLAHLSLRASHVNITHEVLHAMRHLTRLADLRLEMGLHLRRQNDPRPANLPTSSASSPTSSATASSSTSSAAPAAVAAATPAASNRASMEAGRSPSTPDTSPQPSRTSLSRQSSPRHTSSPGGSCSVSSSMRAAAHPDSLHLLLPPALPGVRHLRIGSSQVSHEPEGPMPHRPFYLTRLLKHMPGLHSLRGCSGARLDLHVPLGELDEPRDLEMDLAELAAELARIQVLPGELYLSAQYSTPQEEPTLAMVLQPLLQGLPGWRAGLRAVHAVAMRVDDSSMDLLVSGFPPSLSKLQLQGCEVARQLRTSMLGVRSLRTLVLRSCHEHEQRRSLEGPPPDELSFTCRKGAGEVVWGGSYERKAVVELPDTFDLDLDLSLSGSSGGDDRRETGSGGSSELGSRGWIPPPDLMQEIDALQLQGE
mmetsp:Transcript_2061/g.4579  ORF Transcript_2061/g.4579 Transcript_2061/m.4579 type:complete len:597 (-) Transcript_2061:653-2443(-)